MEKLCQKKKKNKQKQKVIEAQKLPLLRKIRSQSMEMPTVALLEQF